VISRNHSLGWRHVGAVARQAPPRSLTMKLAPRRRAQLRAPADPAPGPGHDVDASRELLPLTVRIPE